MSPRSYRNNLAFVEAGFKACWGNAKSLVQAADLLLRNGQHALAMSMSVLALEELGKLFCLDGLLFARTDDFKSDRFATSLKNHATKLEALQLLPLFLMQITNVVARSNESAFKTAVALGIEDLRDRAATVRGLLAGGAIRGLDQWKQAGFYAHPKGNLFIRPADAVSRAAAETVYMYAWRAVSTFDFLFKGEGLQGYMEMAHSLRSKLSEEDHASVSELSERICEDLFSSEDKSGDGAQIH